MSILKTCCCCISIRRGSIAIGLFTLIYYTIVVAIGAFHVHEKTYSAGLVALSFIIVIFSGFSVAASVFLLVGLSVDCKPMLLPWIIIILMTTSMDIIYSFLWLIEINSNPAKIKREDRYAFIVLIADLIMCAFNFYGIVCVISQYQEYSQGRGSITCPSNNKNLLPPIEFRLIQLQNSNLKPKRSERDLENKLNESIVESDLLKVPKCVESSSGSSNEMSEGSLLTDVFTTNEDSRNDSRHSVIDSTLNKKLNKEVMLTIESNNDIYNNSIITTKQLNKLVVKSV